ncbi:unnamed protein product [Tetraodon nigroviridis]|uniref:(spotted green pufferfish) hypothetical protein n=1 Tax=Tetraodon nigroviridis TaxID=99883 RepID=Q4RQT8_TETNG|nr:unnamed protein product [Tetraodon nigroviridis]
MRTYSIVILLVTLSAACGLKCYACVGDTCTTQECPSPTDQCTTIDVNGLVTKSCLASDLCVSPIKCCSTDLCNSAGFTGSSVLLLLGSAAITSVFL